MVQHKDDVDGCGCSRCQGIDSGVLQQSLFDGFVWSIRLPFRHASIVFIFFVVAVMQLAVLFATGVWSTVAAIGSILGVFLGRGYIGVIGRMSLAKEEASPGLPLVASKRVLRRLPAFLGAVAIVVVACTVVAFSAVVARDPLSTVAETVGVSAVVAESFLLAVLICIFLSVLVKFCFLPEACFVGGYGPINALQSSWRITTVHTKKAVGIVAGFVFLLGIGVVFDTQFADPSSPVALSVRYQETTVVLRSFGFSTAGGIRFVFDLLVTMGYSGVFVHQYIHGIFE